MEALVNTIIKAFGWSIFHSLWQGAIIYGILFLTLMCKSGLSAKLKHNLALGAICLMFFSFLLTFASILKLPSGGLNISVPQQVAFNFNPAAATEPLSFASVAERYFPYLVGLYTLGLLIQVSVIFYGYKKLERIKHAIHNKVPQRWHEHFQEVLAQLKINRAVAFYLSDKVNVPLVIGFFKPVILFPLSFATQLDIQQVEAILIHELSHIRRNDFLLNLIKTGIETMLFFNPFVWLSSRFISIEREHDCDDLVVRFTGTPLTYAHALLKIELIKDKHTPALSLAASGSSQHLYHRIKRITDMKTTYMNAKQRIFAITLTVTTIISLAWVSPEKEKQAVKTAAGNLVQHIQVFAQRTVKEESSLPSRNNRLALAIDSPEKKKKVKIITVDEKGNKKEYNSISELPDSLKEEAGESMYRLHAIETPIIDSATLIALQKNAEAIAAHFNSPEMKAKWEKFGKEMEKTGKAFERKFNTPEQQAKWEKFGKEMEKKVEVFMTKLNTPDVQAKIKKLTEATDMYAEGMEAKTASPAHIEEMKRLNDEIRVQSKEMQKMMLGPEIEKQLKDLKLNYKYELDSPESAALKNSDEYRKLKKDFEAKVEKLKKKQEQKK